MAEILEATVVVTVMVLGIAAYFLLIFGLILPLLTRHLDDKDVIREENGD